MSLSQPTLLSFDTSAHGLSVAVSSGGKILAEVNHDSEGGARENRPDDKSNRQEAVSMLMPTIDQVVRGAGLKKSDLVAIAVGIGPGGFTGVRVTVVTGRTLAQALGLPLVGINSLEVASYNEPSAGRAGVIMSASKTHCFIARYERVPFADDLYDLKPLLSPSYLTTEATAELLESDPNLHWYCEPSLLPRFENFAPRLTASMAVNNVAACQAKIAHVRLSLKAGGGEGSAGDCLKAFPFGAVQPLYLRGASVTLKRGDVVERVETH